MKDTINIAGVNCKVALLGTLDYEILFRLAKHSIKWRGVKNREYHIDKELREHGFKPIRKTTKRNRGSKQAKRKGKED